VFIAARGYLEALARLLRESGDDVSAAMVESAAPAPTPAVPDRSEARREFERLLIRIGMSKCDRAASTPAEMWVHAFTAWEKPGPQTLRLYEFPVTPCFAHNRVVHPVDSHGSLARCAIPAEPWINTQSRIVVPKIQLPLGFSARSITSISTFPFFDSSLSPSWSCRAAARNGWFESDDGSTGASSGLVGKA